MTTTKALETVFNLKADIDLRKKDAQAVLDQIYKKDASLCKALDQQVPKTTIDVILAGTKDRELQFLILKLVISSHQLPKFKMDQLADTFIKINFKSFKDEARKFLDKIEIYHKKEDIISYYSSDINIEHGHERVSTCGWIDLNQDCIGITSDKDGSEIYTEIKYSCLDDWFIIEDTSMLCLGMHEQSTWIRIALDEAARLKVISLLSKKNCKGIKKSEPLLLINVSKGKQTPKLKKRSSIENSFSQWINRKLQTNLFIKKAKRRLLRRTKSKLNKFITKSLQYHRTKSKLNKFITKSLQYHLRNVAGCLNELVTSESMIHLQSVVSSAKQNRDSIEKMIQNCDSFISPDNLR